jgi:hypothetical protein
VGGAAAPPYHWLSDPFDRIRVHVQSCFRRADAGKMVPGLGTGCGIVAQMQWALRQQIKLNLQVKNEFPIRQ